MTTELLWIVGFTLLGGVLSVLAAASVLLLSESARARLLPILVSFAVGALLGVAFLALLPHALESQNDDGIHALSFTVLLGLLGFFLLEKMVIWRHCHSHDCEAHGAGEPEHAVNIDLDEMRTAAAGKLILIGDGIHNLVDGVLIAAAFLTDIHLGVVTSVAVVAHEIPQEVGDFTILLHSGFSRARAFAYNVLTSMTMVVGGVVAYFSLAAVLGAVPYVLAVAASGFIYVAVADLIPGLHRRLAFSATLQQVSLIALGVATIFITHAAAH